MAGGMPRSTCQAVEMSKASGVCCCIEQARCRIVGDHHLQMDGGGGGGGKETKVIEIHPLSQKISSHRAHPFLAHPFFKVINFVFFGSRQSNGIVTFSTNLMVVLSPIASKWLHCRARR